MGKEHELPRQNHPTVREIVEAFEHFELNDIESMQVLNDLIDTITEYTYGSRDKSHLPTLEDLISCVIFRRIEPSEHE